MKKLIILLLSIALFIVPTSTSAFTDTTSATQGAVVKNLADEGIVNGYPDRTFRPDLQITRAQAAAMITRAVTLPAIRPATTFQDLPTTHNFYDNIQELYKAGIIDGYNNHFYPDQSITRGELAKVLTLTFNLTQSPTTKFTDVYSGHWTTPYVGALVNAEITRGYDDGTFKPHNYVTRGEFAYFIYRALYGPETMLDAVTIEDLTRYQPTNLSNITYEVFDLYYDGSYNISSDFIEQHDTAFFDTGGLFSFNFRQDTILYGPMSSDLTLGQVYTPLRKNMTTEKTIDIGLLYPEYVTYKYTLSTINQFQIKAGLFNNVSKVTVTSSATDVVEALYFKEGYGLLKHEYAGSHTQYKTKVGFELINFELQ